MKRTLARGHAIDRLGVLLTAVGVAALVFLPFVVFKANRILPGDARSLFAILPLWAALAFHAVLVLAAVTALRVVRPRVRLAMALMAVAALIVAIGAAGDALTPIGDKVVRVS